MLTSTDCRTVLRVWTLTIYGTQKSTVSFLRQAQLTWVIVSLSGTMRTIKSNKNEILTMLFLQVAFHLVYLVKSGALCRAARKQCWKNELLFSPRSPLGLREKRSSDDTAHLGQYCYHCANSSRWHSERSAAVPHKVTGFGASTVRNEGIGRSMTVAVCQKTFH